MFDLTTVPPELQNGSSFLSAFGSFWSSIYGDQPVLAAHFQGLLQLWQQSQMDYLANRAALSRYDIPVFRRKQWQLLTIYLSDRNDAIVDPLLYGTGLTYGSGNLYDGTAPTTQFNYPSGLTQMSAGLVMSTPLHPATVLVQGVDFQLNGTTQVITFAQDPFASPNFITRSEILPDGTVDQAIDLWLYAVDIDWQAVQQQFGYALGFNYSVSSSFYKDLVNAYWNCLSEGPSILQLRLGVAAACQLPAVKNDGEVIQHVVTHPDRFQVITDQNVYDYPAGGSLAAGWSVGSTLNAGDVLTGAIQVFELGNWANLNFSAIPSLSIGPELCSLPLTGRLTFVNGLYSTSYSVDGAGNAIVTFGGVTGASADVTAFWAYVNAQTDATGNSVAQVLRKVPGTGQPTADQIYTMVNPLYFLIQQVLNVGVILVVVNTSQLGANADMSQLFFLRKVMPAHAVVLFCDESGNPLAGYTGVVPPST